MARYLYCAVGETNELAARETRAEGGTRTHHDRPWQVVVWNDPITLMSYVVLVFRRLFGYDLETATRLMLQVHNEGRAVVATEPRERAEVAVAQLHAHGLQATLARD